ncbi:GTP 3',8-cyclase MoaA [Sporomusa sp.]|uniref:GTP 3',8-cyclase MoaA n=1 Tax=Sporomusa sp. TaxID=2078658 RepID=UPI002C3359BE|nr:GTP 3',8-cyclase MoaA [Sporomusa sp.]HWR42975.1 GTP 3',8-cyclase MoaA [Sporomusa sp.]
MWSGYGRVVDYLRISVTDRCNFRCGYCMPPEGIKLLGAQEVLSYEELLRIITILGQHGVSKVRLTGGEPLVRKGIVDFIRSTRAIGTVKDLSMTTNGSLLGDMAHQLKAAGLDRVNISIDTRNPERFARITGRGKVADTLEGIRSAIEAGLNPVKLNIVLTEELFEEDVFYFIDQVHRYPIAIRFIEYMPIGQGGVKPGASIAAIKSVISNAGYGALESVVFTRGNGPAKYYRLPRALGVFGFITPISEHFCHTCNRIRLTADGKIKPCLLANHEIDLKVALRSGGDDKAVYELFERALREKPFRHKLGECQDGTPIIRGMSQVGG